MYLKRQELCGFKSFPDRVELEFEQGITAIVGPNGCGKTNIAEAVCWVLGEQSAHSLRGEKMEDVIFHGSRERKSLGMAEVSLTFDNSDRRLPLDYSEVTITRRLFRSGESEYFLNKIPSRLKDITELFLDTGVGVDAYSHWELSRLDLILNLPPRGRRFIFEEAAGIAKFKLRKKETLRKLEVTEQNLHRVKDIILEVKRQTGSLERQVKKVEKYQQLKAELKEIEISLIRKELLDFREKLSLRERNHRSLEDRMIDLTAQIANCEAAVEELQLSLREREEYLTKILSIIDQCNDQIGKSQSKIQLAEERIKNAGRLETDLHSIIEENEKKLLEVEAGMNHTSPEKETLEIRMIEKEEQLKKLEGQIQEYIREWKIKEEGLEIQKGKVSDLSNQLAHQRNNLHQRELEEENLLRQKQKIREQRDENYIRLEEISGRKVKLVDEIQQAEKDIIGYRREISILQEQKEHRQNSLSELEKEIMGQKLSLAGIENQIYFLQESIEDYYQRIPEIKVLLAKNQEWQGICGFLGDLIQVSQEYEPALVAALGDKSQWIITDNEVIAEKGREFFRREASGKVHFIPLDIFSRISRQYPVLPSGEGILGRIINFISCEDKYRPLIEYLLWDKVVVKEWKVAHELMVRGFQGTAITLEGESISWPGIMLVGRERILSPLSRKRGLEELTTKFQEIKESLPQLEKKREDEEQNLRGLSERLQSWQEKLYSREILLQSCKVEQQELEKNISYLNQEKERLAREEKPILTEQDQAQKQRKYFQQVIADLSREVPKEDEKLQQMQEQMRILQEKKDKLEVDLIELRVEMASGKEKLLGLEDGYRQFFQRKKEIQQELDRYRSRLQEQGEGRREWWELIKQEEQVLNHTQEDKKLQETKLREIKDRLSQEEKKLEEYQEKLKNLRKEYQEVLNQKHQEEMLKMQLEMEIGHREQRISTEFGIDIKELPELDMPVNYQELSARREDLRVRLETLGPVNLLAQEEHQELQKRYQFLTQQYSDLESAKDSLIKLIERINQTSVERFQEAFVSIKKNFQEIFTRLFGGGEADLILTEGENGEEGGVEIVAQPPGKRLQNISLLSGGERALVGIALLFAIFLWKPTPFCVLDEIDAPLDEVNIGRFVSLLKEFSQKSQFIIITHNKRTMEIADTLYGVTMEETGVSKLVAVKFTPEGKVLVGG